MIPLLLATMVVLTLETALATFVATRAWDYRPARLFVPLVASLSLLNLLVVIRGATDDLAVLYVAHAVATLVLAALCATLLLFFSALFVPQWWEGARPIRWIALPYALALPILALDMFGRLGLIVRGLRFSDGISRLDTVQPGGSIALALFVVGWIVQLALLGSAFVRDRRTRPALGLLALAIVLASSIGLFVDSYPALDQFGGLIQTLLLIGALAVVVLRTRLFTPTRAALDLAIQAMSEAVAVLDRDAKVIYANPQAASLGLWTGHTVDAALRGGGADPYALANLLVQVQRIERGAPQILTIDERRIELSSAPVSDPRGRLLGTLLLGRDVTELERRNALLEQERGRLADSVRALEAGRRERAELVATVAGLSLPLIPVLDGVLVLPLVGPIDSGRIAEFTRVLLGGIERERARLVLIDVTGVPLLDEVAAAGLLRGVRAAGLLGARCVLVGVRPEIAEALVALGVPLGRLATAATLQQAIRDELRLDVLAR